MHGVHCDISLKPPHDISMLFVCVYIYIVLHCESVLLCRARHRWWLTALNKNHDIAIPMDQLEGSFEMDGEVTFRRGTKTNMTKAVSGTEWMCRKRALEIGRWVSICPNGTVFIMNRCG